MYQAPPALRRTNGVDRARLAQIGARRGAGLGVLSALLYGWSVIALINSHRDAAGLLFWVVVTTIPITVLGGLPALLLGWLLGGIIGDFLRSLPARATPWHAAALGATVTSGAVLLLHGLWIVAGGEIGWAADVQDNTYRLFLGQPSGVAVVLSAIAAARLYHRVQV